MEVRFVDLPHIGTELAHQSKWGRVVYTLVGADPYVRKRDGVESCILTWITVCPVCLTPFHVTTGLNSKLPAVRCGNCRLGKAKRKRRP
jgi:hypothetical protein